MPFKFNNYAKVEEEQGQNNYYRWVVFMDEAPETLEQVAYVVYRLDESFPDPLRRVLDPEKRFALQEASWGAFDIYITVYLRNGDDETTVYHLDLAKFWPNGDPVGEAPET